MAQPSSSNFDDAIEALLVDIGKMDPSEKDALEKKIQLRAESTMVGNVGDIAQIVLGELDRSKLDPVEAKILQDNINQALQDSQGGIKIVINKTEEAPQEEIQNQGQKERGKTILEENATSVEELAQKWDSRSLLPDEKEELIKKLLEMIEDMHGKLLTQRSNIEEQKKTIQRLANQLSILRKKLNVEKRKGGLNPSLSKSFSVNPKVGGVLREHTRILEDCVYLMRRQMEDLKKRDANTRKHENKIFNECYAAISQLISELKKIDDTLKSTDHVECQGVVQPCIQKLSRTATELQRKEALNLEDPITNTIFEEYSQMLENHLDRMQRRRSAGEDTKIVFQEFVKLLNSQIDLLDKRGVEFFGEEASKVLSVFLKKIQHKVEDLERELEPGVDSNITMNKLMDMVHKHLGELAEHDFGAQSTGTLSPRSGKSGERKPSISAMELREVENLVTLLESGRNEQEELFEHDLLQEEMESDPESRNSKARSHQQNGSNNISRDNEDDSVANEPEPKDDDDQSEALMNQERSLTRRVVSFFERIFDNDLSQSIMRLLRIFWVGQRIYRFFMFIFVIWLLAYIVNRQLSYYEGYNDWKKGWLSSQNMKHWNEGWISSDNMKYWNEAIKDWHQGPTGSIPSPNMKDWNQYLRSRGKHWKQKLRESIAKSPERVSGWNQNLKDMGWKEKMDHWNRELKDAIGRSSERVKSWRSYKPDWKYKGTWKYFDRNKRKEKSPPGPEEQENYENSIPTPTPEEEEFQYENSTPQAEELEHSTKSAHLEDGDLLECGNNREFEELDPIEKWLDPQTDNSWKIVRMAKGAYQKMLEVTYLVFLFVAYLWYVFFEGFKRIVEAFLQALHLGSS